MQMRFTGQSTNGRTTITYLDCTFAGHEPREVSGEVAAMLANHPEFEVIAPVDEVAEPEFTAPPKKRGRPKKVAE